MFQGIEPNRVLHYFYEISKIPRCSLDEERISNYLLNIGKKLGLETIQDEELNIIIKKPGTIGYEDKPIVVLQGHMDMVCEKNEDFEFDFSKNPIEVELEGDFLLARNTTLGADNGIAVAMCLAILESKDIEHPPLEVLITSNEESGMTGAEFLNPENIEGRLMINLDAEEEGAILVSCAGGERNLITISIDWEELQKSEKSYSLEVLGLQGGHSGIDIHKGRGNANKIMGRILENLFRVAEIDIYNIEGGALPNAIPRYGKADIVFKDKDKQLIFDNLEKLERDLTVELSSTDRNISLKLEENNMEVKRVFSKETTIKVINALMLIPDGVQTMSGSIDNLVESSNNLGVVKTKEESITIECAIRSSVDSLKTLISDKIRIIGEVINSKWESLGSYPSWEYREDSYLREVAKNTYKELYNKDLNIGAIHAGLECGLFSKKFPQMDMIALGPNMIGVHAPGEKVSISSIENTWKFLLKILSNIE